MWAGELPVAPTVFSACLRHPGLKSLPTRRAPAPSGGAGRARTSPTSPPGQEGSCRWEQKQPTHRQQRELSIGKGFRWHLQKQSATWAAGEEEGDGAVASQQGSKRGGEGKCSAPRGLCYAENKGRRGQRVLGGLSDEH